MRVEKKRFCLRMWNNQKHSVDRVIIKQVQLHPFTFWIIIMNIEYVDIIVKIDQLEQIIAHMKEAKLPQLNLRVKSNKPDLLYFSCMYWAVLENEPEDLPR